MQDRNDRTQRLRRVRFPVIGPLLIQCPICNGKKCNVCNQIFNTDTITLDEYNFSWDGYVTTDCCSKCSDKVLMEAK